MDIIYIIFILIFAILKELFIPLVIITIFIIFMKKNKKYKEKKKEDLNNNIANSLKEGKAFNKIALNKDEQGNLIFKTFIMEKDDGIVELNEMFLKITKKYNQNENKVSIAKKNISIDINFK